MCFHWCSACGVLQTEVGRPSRSNKMLIFLNSILPLCCCFFISLYSLISSLPRSAQCVCVHPLVMFTLLLLLLLLRTRWQCLSLSLSLTPPSPNSLHPLSLTPPLSFSHTYTRSSFMGKWAFADSLLSAPSLCATDTLSSHFCHTFVFFFFFYHSLSFFPKCFPSHACPLFHFIHSSPFTSCLSNLYFDCLFFPFLNYYSAFIPSPFMVSKIFWAIFLSQNPFQSIKWEHWCLLSDRF